MLRMSCGIAPPGGSLRESREFVQGRTRNGEGSSGRGARRFPREVASKRPSDKTSTLTRWKTWTSHEARVL